MNESGLREIDRRVALELGYRWVYLEYKGQSAFLPGMNYRWFFCDWTEFKGDWQPCTPRDGNVPPSDGRSHAPCYTTDPRCADLVKAQLRAEKHEFSAGWVPNYELYRGGPYWSSIDRVNTEPFFMSVCRCEGEGTALCLSFLLSRLPVVCDDEVWIILAQSCEREGDEKQWHLKVSRRSYDTGSIAGLDWDKRGPSAMDLIDSFKTAKEAAKQ